MSVAGAGGWGEQGAATPRSLGRRYQRELWDQHPRPHLHAGAPGQCVLLPQAGGPLLLPQAGGPCRGGTEAGALGFVAWEECCPQRLTWPSGRLHHLPSLE